MGWCQQGNCVLRHAKAVVAVSTALAQWLSHALARRRVPACLTGCQTCSLQMRTEERRFLSETEMLDYERARAQQGPSTGWCVSYSLPSKKTQQPQSSSA